MGGILIVVYSHYGLIVVLRYLGHITMSLHPFKIWSVVIRHWGIVDVVLRCHGSYASRHRAIFTISHTAGEIWRRCRDVQCGEMGPGLGLHSFISLRTRASPYDSSLESCRTSLYS